MREAVGSDVARSVTEESGTPGLGGLGVPGSPTGLSCPRCGGVLGEKAQEGQVQLECRVGHVLPLDGLLDAKATDVEDALWAAVRALEEKAALGRRMCERARHSDDVEAASRHERLSMAASRRAKIVRDILASHEHDLSQASGE